MRDASEAELNRVRSSIAARYGEDIAQDALLAALERNLPDQEWQGYALATARYLYINSKVRREESPAHRAALHERPIVHVPDTQDIVLARAVLREIPTRALDALGERQRSNASRIYLHKLRKGKGV